MSLNSQLAAETRPGFFGLSATTIEGKDLSFSSYFGKVLLVVNTASECGYTSQYKGLQELADRYRARGLVVIGFPSNDYGGQEPGTNAEIKTFCERKYKVTFPMFAKMQVKGASKSHVYKFLTEESAKPFTGEVSWNFEKFLVNRTGDVVGRFKSNIAPDSTDLVNAIEKALAQEVPKL